MWWAGAEATDVYLSSRCIAVFEGQERVCLQRLGDGDTPAPAFEDWAHNAKRRLRIRVWVSGGICRAFLVPAADQLKNRAEALKVAEAMAPDSTGLASGCSVWLDSDQGAKGVVAAAIDQGTLTGVLEVTRLAGLRLLSLRPWWAELLRAAVAQASDIQSVAVHDCDSVTVLAGQGDRLEFATTHAPVGDRATAEATIRRLMMLASVAPGGGLMARLTPDSDRIVATQLPMALGQWAEILR